MENIEPPEIKLNNALDIAKEIDIFSRRKHWKNIAERLKLSRSQTTQYTSLMEYGAKDSFPDGPQG